MMTDFWAGVCIGIGLTISVAIIRDLYRDAQYTTELLAEGDLCEKCLRGE